MKGSYKKRPSERMATVGSRVCPNIPKASASKIGSEEKELVNGQSKVNGLSRWELQGGWGGLAALVYSRC